MEIELTHVPVRDLVKGYADAGDVGGVVGYGGRLDIRPAYQREFVYKDSQRDAVIRSVMAGFPLNVMYWSVRDDGTFEIIDGQQRTISLAQYANHDFSVDNLQLNNLPDDEREKFLNYELTVYRCRGKTSERLAWFKTINIAGEPLLPQELRNAVYHGAWLADAKRSFSRNGCRAYLKGKQYVRGSAIRQDFLQTAIEWAAGKGNIEEYMASHQHEPSADPLWSHYATVIDWVEATFPHYRSTMKGENWGALYAAHKNDVIDPEQAEAKLKRLVLDDDVSSKRGIYRYILTGDEKHLNIRAFTPAQRQAAYERQGGHCPRCDTGGFTIEDMDADHITPWVDGGKTEAENCQMLCKPCNRSKGAA